MSSRLLQFPAFVAMAMAAGAAPACPGVAMKSTDGAKAPGTASSSRTMKAHRG